MSMGVKVMVLACCAWVQIVAGWMASAACSRAWVGGERCEAIVAVSRGCLYSEAVRSLCRVWMRAPRKWRRHFVGLRPAKAGLKIEHGSRADFGGVLLARVMVGI